MSEMTKRSGPGPAELASGDSERRAAPAARPPDRRRQRRWVPVVAAWLTFLVGLADIILGFRTKVIYAHVNHPLHRISEIVPGALSNLTRTADVIILWNEDNIADKYLAMIEERITGYCGYRRVDAKELPAGENELMVFVRNEGTKD